MNPIDRSMFRFEKHSFSLQERCYKSQLDFNCFNGFVFSVTKPLNEVVINLVMNFTELFKATVRMRQDILRRLAETLRLEWDVQFNLRKLPHDTVVKIHSGHTNSKW